MDLSNEDFQKLDKSQIILSEQFLLLGESFAGLTIPEIENRLDGIDHLLKNIIGIIQVPEVEDSKNPSEKVKAKVKIKKHFISGS